MKKYYLKKLSLFASVILLAFVLYAMYLEITGGDIFEEKCIIGKMYVMELRFDENNPFEKSTFDTVLVLDKKDGYVKYRYLHRFDTTFFQSRKEKYFMQDCKLINK